MTAQTEKRPTRSGFCNLSWPLDTPDGARSHGRCRLDGCPCDCHYIDVAGVRMRFVADDGVPKDTAYIGALPPVTFETEEWNTSMDNLMFHAHERIKLSVPNPAEVAKRLAKITHVS